jgi:flavin-dependent dehydrogenase
MVDADVIVIGGGPAGSTVSTRLAQRGRKLILLEKEPFPRFHIGESLLPCSMPLFEELGVLPKLEAAKFLPKYAAEFVSYDGSLQRRYPFANGVIPGPDRAFEVERAVFDKILLDHSASVGVDVRQGHQVTNFDVDGKGPVRVSVREPSGETRELTAEFLIDASGQSSLLASRMDLRQMDPTLKNFAVFSHFRGASRYTGDREGDISIVLVPGGWWWVIPLADDKTSVGLVAPGRFLKGQKPDEAFFQRQIDATPFLKARLEGAERIAPVRTTSDFSYTSRRVTGDRWLLVGDAAAFIDPVFSTGVYLGMIEAFRAADAVDHALSRDRFKRSMFSSYERFAKSAVRAYRDFVKGFYTPEFAEVMMHPSDFLQLRQAVTSLLAGYGVGRREVDWRIRVFRLITKLNRRFPLTPRLPGRREMTAFDGS